MALSPRAGLFGGVALLSAAVVLLQIVLTRLFSALFGQHVALLAVSLALFGAGAGSALLHAAPAIARPPGLLARLSVLCCLMSGATVGALLVLLRLKPITTLGPSELGRAAIVYGVSSLPFVLAGAAMAGAVRHASSEMSKLYLTDLTAAAAGGVAAMFALRLGAPRAALAAAILAAIAALWFALPLPAPRHDVEDAAPLAAARRAPAGPYGFVATMLLGTSVLLAGDFGAPWLKIGDVRDSRIDRVEYQRWSLLSLVTVDRPASGIAWLRQDGGSTSAILDAKTSSPLHPDEMGYALHKERGPVLVIGPGGGRDVRAALKVGQTDIDAAEIDPVIVEDVMRDRYREFSGDLYGRPEVHVTVADGRGFVRRTDRRYRAIVLSLVDTFSTSAVSAPSMAESSLYTVEAFRDFILRLSPEGTLTVNRWDGEAPRLLALAAAGLRAAGAESPKAHIFACSHDRTTALLIKRTPYIRDEILTLRKHCNKNKFREVFAPDVIRDAQSEQLVASRRGFIAASGQDLRAPTDDRPFFFHTAPAGALPALLAKPSLAKDHPALALLSAVFALSAAVAALLLVVPFIAAKLRMRDHTAAEPPSRARPLFFFLSTGAGFLLVEIGVMQKLTLFLGHPAYALSAALVPLLLSAGLGGLSTARVPLESAPALVARRAQALIALLAVLAVALGPVLSRAMVLPLPARALFASALLFPVGALMGSMAPPAVRLVARTAPELLPWCWGLSGLAGVMGAALGMFAAMSFGHSATLLLAGAAYVVAAISVPRGEAPAAAPRPRRLPFSHAVERWK